MPRDKGFSAIGTLDCLRQAVDLLGGPKEVAHAIWPKKDPIDRAKWLNRCLDENRTEKLGVDELFLILKLCCRDGYHAPKHWLDEQLGYLPSNPIDHLNEFERIMREMSRLNREAESLAQKMSAEQPGRSITALKVA